MNILDTAAIDSRLRQSGRGLAMRIGFVLLVIVVLVGVGFAITWRVVSEQRAADRFSWQTRLGIIADSRVGSITQWLDNQFEALQAIAENQAVRLYTTNIVEMQPSERDRDIALAQREYLKNLVELTAAQAGFRSADRPVEVPANVRRVGRAGIVLISENMDVVAASSDAPALDETWHAYLREVGGGLRAVRGPYTNAGGEIVLGFVMPLYGLGQSEGMRDTEQLGYVIGVKPARELFSFLPQPGSVYSTLEAVLVKRRDAGIQYVSPLADGTAPLAKILAADTPGLAAASGLAAPGGFGTARNYAGREVLVTSRPVPGSDWTLVQMIGREEALGHSDERTHRYTLIAALVIGLFVVAFLAIWRHGISVRVRDALDLYRSVASELAFKEELLTSVTNTVPDDIFLVTKEGKVRFSNRALAERLGVDQGDLQGKQLPSVLGPGEADFLEDLIQEARVARTMVVRDARTGGAEGRIVQLRVIPLSPASREVGDCLVVATDITEAVSERERRKAASESLISAMVEMADQRDPSARGQSEKVALIASQIASEMDIDKTAVETISIAAKLVNFYKILVPVSLLTKSEALEEDERAVIAQARLRSADFLQKIDFQGPVAETLRQLDEHYDGSGRPRGLRGDEILVTAQVAALANAFVAMTSDRSYRHGMTMDDAIARISKVSGEHFSPKVVAAFLNYMENHGGRKLT